MAKEPQAVAEPTDPRVRVVVTCDHLYLPLDGGGNVPMDHEPSMWTTRVNRRTRLLVPPDMGNWMQNNDKGEVL